MPFKIPRPTFDEALVLEIEDHLRQDAMTEIVERYTIVDGDGEPVGMEGHRVRGKHHPDGRRDANYARQMIQLIENGASSASMLRTVINPCFHCLDFAYTRDCPEHGDPGKRRAGTQKSVDFERHPDGQPVLYVDEGNRPPMAPPGGLYDRMIEMFTRELPGWGNTPTWAADEPNVHADPPAPNFRFEAGQFVPSTSHLLMGAEGRRRTQEIASALPPGEIAMSGYFRAVAGEFTTNHTRNGNGTFVVHVEADTVAGDHRFSFEVEPSGE